VLINQPQASAHESVLCKHAKLCPELIFNKLIFHPPENRKAGLSGFVCPTLVNEISCTRPDCECVNLVNCKLQPTLCLASMPLVLPAACCTF